VKSHEECKGHKQTKVIRLVLEDVVVAEAMKEAA